MSDETKDRVQAHLDNVFGKVPTEPRTDWQKLGEPQAKKGVQSVFKEIFDALDRLEKMPMFGPASEGLKYIRRMLHAKETQGIKKYGASLETWNGRDPLQDAMEEEVDRIPYLVQARLERADMIELINDLKRKNAQLEKDLDAANTALAVKQATPTQAPGANLEPPSHAASAAGDPVQLPHARAYRDRLCNTGLIPDERWPDMEDVLRDFCLTCYANSALHGFWGEDAERYIKEQLIEGKPFTVIPEKLMLIVSEISEALECYRAMDSLKKMHGVDGWLYYVTGAGKPEGYLAELADAVIRIGDLVGSMNLNKEFVQAIRAKMKYNQARPHMHGKTC